MSKRAAHYVTRIARDICEHIALGSTLGEALTKVGYLAPSMHTVWRWLDEHEEFREMYERARQLQADTHADRMLELSREVIGRPQAATAYRTAIDVLKWQAETRNRARYGNKATEETRKPMNAAELRKEIARLEGELGIEADTPKKGAANVAKLKRSSL